MFGLFSLLAYVAIGAVVAAVVRRGNASRELHANAIDPAAPLRAASSTDQSLFGLTAEAFGWGTLGAFLTAAAGLAGHLLGSSLYPQPYEQIPSDFFFVPLGMVVGFVAAGTGRVVRRDWGAGAMAAAVGLLTILWAAAMFDYSRARALPAHVDAALEPATVAPIDCSPDTCAVTDPPSQFYVTGRLRLTTTRLGATIDSIEITSNTDAQGPVTLHRYTKEEAAEAARWQGPRVTLSGRNIPGPRHLVPDTESTYPITYPYYTRNGSSRRTISISAYLTDAAGKAVYAGTTWKVR